MHSRSSPPTSGKNGRAEPALTHPQTPRPRPCSNPHSSHAGSDLADCTLPLIHSTIPAAGAVEGAAVAAVTAAPLRTPAEAAQSRVRLAGGTGSGWDQGKAREDQGSQTAGSWHQAQGSSLISPSAWERPEM
ncbi:hypothetical protein NDU88_006478 [Pleurodeles waltl]|uniref:Uncharacterized protein n=1 Tax=Pleurodeles waltl TaxID=8319 RepID=A0AAV7MF35_PLEWA|nr:hypothetical protein NDU88_006478 [Pleurodeles waltl]